MANQLITPHGGELVKLAELHVGHVRDLFGQIFPFEEDVGPVDPRLTLREFRCRETLPENAVAARCGRHDRSAP